MFKPGKHAKIKLCKKSLRISKMYKNIYYTKNEYFALNFLAKSKILNLNPKQESIHTLSMDFLPYKTQQESNKLYKNIYFPKQLANKLKMIHNRSFYKFNAYLNHRDLFDDNILIDKNNQTLHLIDWGLSKLEDSVYSDIASALMGVFNTDTKSFLHFLKEYFNTLESIDGEEIKSHLYLLYKECYTIRTINNIETKSLKNRLNNAEKTINKVIYSIQPAKKLIV